MPPRFAYWTILAGGLPTAFRAADRDELMPTFQRLREKHPDAVMRWFARGKLWDSPDDARAAYEQRRQPPDRRRERGSRPGATGTAPKEPRGRDWRPGGDHRDPRQKYADAKKARNAARRKERFERKQGAPVRRDDTRPFETTSKRHRDDRPPGHLRDREKPTGPAAGWEKRPPTGPKPRPNLPGERRPFERKQGAPVRRDDTRPFGTTPNRHRDDRLPRQMRDREKPAGSEVRWDQRPHTGPKPRPTRPGERRPFERPSFPRTPHGEKPATAGRPPQQPRDASGNAPRGKPPSGPQHKAPPSRPRERDRRFRR